VYGPLSTPEISDRSGILFATVFNNVKQLENIGVLHADVAREQRHGRRTTWGIDEYGLHKALSSARSYLER
jgi:hypothetical protein